MDAPHAAKKRKLTDKTLPSFLTQSADFPDSQFYQELLQMERKLDWTMMRKKVELQDALGKPTQTTRTLRVFLSHTVSDQPWQFGSSNTTSAEDPNFDTGKGIPSWEFKIEGRLLDPPGRSREKQVPRKFSSFIESMVIDLDRDTNLYPDGNIVEWRRPQVPPQSFSPMDGFTVRRKGDVTTKIRVVLHLEHYPKQFKVAPELGSILDMKEETRAGVIKALWNYIKVKGLQDKVDRRIIKADASLRAIFGADQLAFQQIPELVNQFLTPPDPVILHYTLNPSQPPPGTPQAWDIEIKMEDTSLKSRMNNVVVNMSRESSTELTNYDDQIAVLIQQIHNSHLKRTFLSTFASNPAETINTWLASQSRDLESILGSGPTEGQTVREEELRRSEFFRLPWVEEAVAIQEGIRLAGRGNM